MALKGPLNVKNQLRRRLGEVGLGLYSFIGCALVMAIVALIGLMLREPMVFPSLGPTLLLFFERSLKPSACPRNTLYGHGIAIIAGWVALAMFGLLGAPSVLVGGITLARIGAAAVSIGLTAFAKHLVRAPHPPAGATTLIVSLGFLTAPSQLAAMAAAVVLITVVGWCVNHLLGVPMPLWRAKNDAAS